MNAGWLMVVMAWVVVGAFVFGGWLTAHMDRMMWLREGYCPTCDRLTTEQECSC